MGLFLQLALVAALAVASWRLVRRLRARRMLRRLPGVTADNAMTLSSLEAIDEEVARRRCHCGGRFDVRGEGSPGDGSRRLRSLMLECRFCEEQSRLYFDVSRLYH